MKQELLASCLQLQKIPDKLASEYASLTARLLENIMGQLESNPKLNDLTGGNPLELIRSQERNHAVFMSTVFRMNSLELLVNTIPWVYRTYHSRGFQYDYFPTELVAWQIALRESIPNSSEIVAIYKWLFQHHEDFIKLSLSNEGQNAFGNKKVSDLQQIFLSFLLNGDNSECLQLVDETVSTQEDLKSFYLDVVWPSLVEIGLQWEANKISVAEEHLATAIVGRIMANLYTRFDFGPVTRGKAIVSAAPNEFHEVGARMVADFIEMAGWDVTYSGANTPFDQLLELVKVEKPFVIALSVATVMSLDNARQFIKLLKEEPSISNTKVMTGGLVFCQMPDLYKEIRADGYAPNAEEAVRLIEHWWEAENSHA